MDGTYTWTFADGRATIDVAANDGRTVECAADMRAIDDGLLALVYDYPGSCGGEIDVIRWLIDDAGLLELTLETTNAPLQDNAAYLETKQWQPVVVTPSASMTPTAAP
jgi:hypothetical protein